MTNSRTKGFEIGKYYRHVNGEVMQIIGWVCTHSWGWTLVAEKPNQGELVPVVVGESYAVNWREVAEDEFMREVKS